MTILTGAQGARIMSESFDDPTRLIDDFRGKYFFLSNFYRQPFKFDGLKYGSSEHAFNAKKTLIPVESEKVRLAATPAAAKSVGGSVTLRDHWDATVRYEVMRAVLDAKFADTGLRAKLLATGTALLIEGNVHHDTHWGTCVCLTHRPWPGANHLGRTLMELRASLREDSPDTWTRVAVTGHRPQALTADQIAWSTDELERLAVKLRDCNGTQVAITGAALGADTYWAKAAVHAGLDLWAYVPFLGQAATWEPAERRTWGQLISLAKRTLVLGSEYDVRLLHARNEFMIRDADMVIAVWDPAKITGGTASTVKKARAAGKTLVIVDVAARRTHLERPTFGALHA